MKDNKQSKITFRLTEDEKQALKEYADALGVSVSEVIRESLAKIIFMEVK